MFVGRLAHTVLAAVGQQHAQPRRVLVHEVLAAQVQSTLVAALEASGGLLVRVAAPHTRTHTVHGVSSATEGTKVHRVGGALCVCGPAVWEGGRCTVCGRGPSLPDRSVHRVLDVELKVALRPRVCEGSISARIYDWHACVTHM